MERGSGLKVGYVVVLSDRDGPGTADRYSAIRDKAVRAEDAGYDSIWIYDHLLYRMEADESTVGIWEGWTVMAALAEATSRVEIGSLVLCNQFRNPAILAKMAHTFDEISEGRLILGIGAGWNRAEFDAFGMPFDHRVSRLEEALQILRPLLTEGAVDFEGDYYSARDCEITPRSPRSAIPLMVGAFGPRTMRLAARYGDMWNTAYYATPGDAQEQISMYHAAVSEIQPDVVPEQTILTGVHFDDLASRPYQGPGTVIDGLSPGAIVEALVQHEAAGTTHLQLHPMPNNNDAIDRMEKALAEWRRSVA
jgi:alkanesulfonate monooxygenase SsuD/methylene tetrahydromethanopterin reductase-like flavin-dependent oxidoreductase (luciferase family)